MSDIKIIRDEDNEVTGFEGDPDEIPAHAQGNPGALVTGRDAFEFETPIWADADTFMEMENAGIVELNPTHPVEFGDHKIWVYETA